MLVLHGPLPLRRAPACAVGNTPLDSKHSRFYTKPGKHIPKTERSESSMLDLFGKKKDLRGQLFECEKKRDWIGLMKIYYDLGVRAMDSGELNEAALWLHRADTIYSAKDEVFEKAAKKRLFHPEIVDDCSDRIGTLESAPLLYNTAPAEVEEKAESLGGGPNVRLWSLMSIARLVSLGQRLAKLPGCEVLGELGWAVDMIFYSLQNAPSEEEYQKLLDLCNRLYDLSDSESFYGGGQIDVPGNAPFQVFDLNGMGTLLELNSYVDSHLRLMTALVQGEDVLPDAETGCTCCTLLPDYYVRTLGRRPEEVPQVQAELQRIWRDYDFVCSAPSWEQMRQKLAEYKRLDILAGNC